MKLSISSIINSRLAIFHDEGIALYDKIQESLSAGEQIEISFAGIDQCSTQFLNASIGKLYLLNEPTIIEAKLNYDFAGQSHKFKDKIDEVIDNAINSKEYNSFLENA